MKVQLVKGIEKMKMFQDYKTFNIESFNKDPKKCLKNHPPTTIHIKHVLTCANIDKNMSL